jgi:hypothetical protein
MTQPTDPAPLRAQVRFAQIPEAVLYHPDLTGDDVRVYGALLRHADADGACFPGRTRLARLCHTSDRGLDHCIERLESTGYLTHRRRWKDRRGTVYYEGGSGRQQTSSEYTVLVALAHGGAQPAPLADRTATHHKTPHHVRTNDNQTTYNDIGAQRVSQHPPVGSPQDLEDRMANRGRYRPATTVPADWQPEAVDQ